MISMLYLEMKLLRKRKIVFIIALFVPIYAILVALLARETIVFVQMFPLLMGWLLIDRVASMKRYRQFESLFSLSLTPKDIFVGNLLALGIYYVCIFLIYLPLYLPGISIGSMTELRVLFLLACLLMGLKGLGNYAAMFLRRLYLIGLANMSISLLFIMGWRYILPIADHPYVWAVLPISLIVIAITYLMSARLSKERVILSSE